MSVEGKCKAQRADVVVSFLTSTLVPLAPRPPALDTHGFFLQETTERTEMKLKRNSVFSVSSW